MDYQFNTGLSYKKFRTNEFDYIKLLFLFSVIFFQLINYLPNFPSTIINMHCVGNISIFDSVENIRSLFGGCDGGSILQIALDLNKFGSLTDDSKHFLNLWPPGLSILHLVPISIFEQRIPILLFYLILYILIFTIIYLKFYIIMSSTLFGKILSFCASIFLIQSSPVNGWFFSSGVLYQETLAFIFIIFGFLILLSNQNLSASNLVLIGILFSLSSYFRSQIDIFNILIQFFWVFLLISFFKFKNNIQFFNMFKKFSLISITLIIFTLPWRLFLGSEVHKGNFSWTVYGEIWKSRWVSSDTLVTQGLSPWVEGGINFACQIDPVKCAKFNDKEFIEDSHHLRTEAFYRNETIKSILNHPKAYLKNRFNVILNHWFTDNHFNYLEKKSMLEGVFFLVTLFFSAVYTIVNFSRYSYLSILYSLFIISALLPFTIFHIEARYLIFLKLTSFLISVYYLHEIYMKHFKTYKLNVSSLFDYI